MLSSQDALHFDTDPNTRNCSRLSKWAIRLIEMQENTKLRPTRTIPYTRIPGQITLRGKFTRIAPATLDPKTVLAHGGAAYLAISLPCKSCLMGWFPWCRMTHSVSLQEKSSGMGIAGSLSCLFWERPGLLQSQFSLYSIRTYLPAGSTTSWKARSGPAYVVLPNSVQEPEVAFRQLHALQMFPRALTAMRQRLSTILISLVDLLVIIWQRNLAIP